MKAGTYCGTFVKGVVTESSKGTPSLAMTFSITHIAEGGDWVELADPLERTVFLYMSDNAWKYSKEKLEKLGFNGDFDNPQIKNEMVNLELKYENYNGADKARWEIAGGGGSFEATEAAPDVKMRLKTLWMAEHRTAAKPSGKPAAPPRKAKPSAGQVAGAMAAQAPTDADSVPF